SDSSGIGLHNCPACRTGPTIEDTYSYPPSEELRIFSTEKYGWNEGPILKQIKRLPRPNLGQSASLPLRVGRADVLQPVGAGRWEPNRHPSRPADSSRRRTCLGSGKGHCLSGPSVRRNRCKW